jgi:acetyl-CoA C-acetyltransferase
MSREVVVLSAVRSAIGTFGGSLANMEPHELAGTVMKESIARSGVDPQQINLRHRRQLHPDRFALCLRFPRRLDPGRSADGFGGHGGQPPVRIGSAGHRDHRPEHHARRRRLRYRRRRRSHVRGSYMLPAMRSGARMGDTKAIDMMVAVLTDPFGVGHMGVTAENLATKWHQPRRAGCLRGRVAAPRRRRHRRRPLQVADRADRQARPARARWCSTPTSTSRRHDHGIAGQDEAGVQEGRHGHRRQRFRHQRRRGLLRAGRRRCGCQAGQKPMARLVSYAVAGVPNDIMGEGPIPATKLALKKAGLTLDQMDVIEANEAFAAQAIAVNKGSVSTRQDQPERRRHRARPPGRLLRRLHRHQGDLRTAAHRRQVRAGHHVYRWRSGYRGDLRTRLSAVFLSLSESPTVCRSGFFSPVTVRRVTDPELRLASLADFRRNH